MKLKNRILLEIIFIAFLIIYVIFNVGIDKMGVFGWSFLAILISIMLIIEFGVGFLINHLFSFLGIQSGNGPLECHMQHQDDYCEVSIENKGKIFHRIIGIQGTDQNGKILRPTPYLNKEDIQKTSQENRIKAFSRTKLKAHEKISIYLDPAELESLNNSSLSILDDRAISWKVIV